MYAERIKFIIALALEAGKLTLEGFGRCGQMPKDAQDGYDIATEYDLRTEELVRQRILDEFGEPVLGEEGGLIGDHETAKHRLWIVDPIDGTFNYQRGLPQYGVSLAFCEAGIPVCGAVFLPALHQLFFASKGAGAFLSQDGVLSPLPLRIGQEREVTRLIIGLAGRDVYRLMAACAKEAIPPRSLRVSMCAVWDLVHIAAGAQDAYCHTALNLWDCAAADVLLREAGRPPAFDYAATSIFPEYVNRLLDHGQESGFTFLAVSSPELFDEPLRRILVAADLLT
jgi:myo-inositol-1(or 4)-monophosphatase